MKRNSLPDGKPRMAQKRPATVLQAGNQEALDEFLMFDAEPQANARENGDAQGRAGETEDDNLMTVDFEMNGQKVSAKMTPTMISFLNENEELRQQIIEKLLSDTTGVEGEQVIITQESEPSSAATYPPPQSTISSSTPGPELKIAGKPLPTPVLQSHNNPGTIKSSPAVKTPRQLASAGASQNHHVRPAVILQQKNVIDTTTMFGSVKGEQHNDIEDPFKWDHKSIIYLLEIYRVVTEKSKKSPRINVWSCVGASMRSKGYLVTDENCEKKIRSLKVSYKTRLKQKQLTGKHPSWEYFNIMDSIFSGETSSGVQLTSTAIPKSQTVTYESLDDSLSSASSDQLSDLDDFGDDLDHSDDNEGPARKKRKMNSSETWGVELFRRTYLKVEKRKLNEMRAARKLQRQMCRLQAERNFVLTSIMEHLRKK